MFQHPAEAFRAAEAVTRVTATGLQPGRLPLGRRIALPARPALGAIGAGALVETETGWLPAAALRPGMAVHTRDGGLRRLVEVSTVWRWGFTGARMLRVPGGVLGLCAPVSLSPEAQVLIASPVAEELLGVPEVLIPAQALDGWRGIRQEAAGDGETVVTLRFERDEIIWLNSGLQVLCGRSAGYWMHLDLERARDLLALADGGPAAIHIAA